MISSEYICNLVGHESLLPVTFPFCPGQLDALVVHDIIRLDDVTTPGLAEHLVGLVIPEEILLGLVGSSLLCCHAPHYTTAPPPKQGCCGFV